MSTIITLDLGQRMAAAQSVHTPLPISWTNRNTMPSIVPTWAQFTGLTDIQIKNLAAQIVYDYSTWNYQKIGANNELGGFQFTATTLENYGVLIAGSVKQHGNSAVNYLSCWIPLTQVVTKQGYAPWVHYATSLQSFLSYPVSQCQLAYKYIFDIYNELTKIGAIKTTDTADVIAGMIYVGWVLGVGTPTTATMPQGTGAYAWRFYNVGSGAQAYNSGRYSVTVLSS